MLDSVRSFITSYASIAQCLRYLRILFSKEFIILTKISGSTPEHSMIRRTCNHQAEIIIRNFDWLIFNLQFIHLSHEFMYYETSCPTPIAFSTFIDNDAIMQFL